MAKKPVVVRGAYNDDYIDPGLDFKNEVSFTHQSFKDECDINQIVEKHQRSGVLPVMNMKPVYGDFSDPVEFQEAQQIVIDATRAFESLDARVRERFNNNVVKFLAFVDDPSNADEMVRLGLREVSSVSDDDIKRGSEAPPKAGEA